MSSVYWNSSYEMCQIRQNLGNANDILPVKSFYKASGKNLKLFKQLRMKFYLNQTSKSSYKPVCALIVVAVVGANPILFSVRNAFDSFMWHMNLPFQMQTECTHAIIIILTIKTNSCSTVLLYDTYRLL